jgi:Uma2 family endonuclease
VVAFPHGPGGYFASEVSAERDALRHEWFDGVVYAMSRGTPEHGRITARTIWALRSALPANCEVYSSDTMLFIDAASLSTYADATVICGPAETFTVQRNGRSLGEAITNPTVVIEVLSDSTERYDRDGKFQAYKRIASLEEYVLVSQDERKVEIFRRSNGYRGDTAKPGETFVLHGVTIAVDDIYGPPVAE